MYQKGLREFLSLGCEEDKVPESVRNAFLSSCAGYCIVTYLLGIGDRHLDNLLVTKQGFLLHIDYGFIFGEDPKPFGQIPMRINSDMLGIIEGDYATFMLECIKGFRALRRNAQLFLSAVELHNPAAVPAVLQKFMFDFSEREAEKAIANVINLSATAVMPAVVDKIHEWVTAYFK
eukprot:Trichotokara_eunicae@DN7030_c0_g1_i1.p1